MIFEFLISIATILALHYVYLLWNRDYWKERGIFCPKSDSLLGNLPGQVTGKRNISYELDDLYKQFKSQFPYIGIYNFRSPRLLVFNPELMKDFLIKYFKNFHATEFTGRIDITSDPLFGNHPFFLVGEAWKKKRAEVSPAFSASRIKALNPIMKDTCDKLVDYIERESKASNFEAFDAKDLAARYTISVVSASVFSAESDALTDSNEPDLLKKTRKMLTPTFKFQLNMIITQIYPFLSDYLKFSFALKESIPFFQNLMKNAVETRIKSKINRADYLDYFVNLMQKKEIGLDSLAGHGATFLTDGYETSSIGISSALYELGMNKNVQDKLRDAILTAMPNEEDFTYDNIMDLEYLDQVWNETLRIHSPLLFLSKKCNEAVEVDMLDGKKYSFNEGEVIYYPVVSIHMDEEYYEDPLSFVPERFDADKGGVKFYKEKGVFLPFGDGPRICVGMRFAIAQSKMALATLVRNFEITVNKKTDDSFEVHPMAILLMNTKPYWLNFKRISK